MTDSGVDEGRDPFAELEACDADAFTALRRHALSLEAAAAERDAAVSLAARYADALRALCGAVTDWWDSPGESDDVMTALDTARTVLADGAEELGLRLSRLLGGSR